MGRSRRSANCRYTPAALRQLVAIAVACLAVAPISLVAAQQDPPDVPQTPAISDDEEDARGTRIGRIGRLRRAPEVGLTVEQQGRTLVVTSLEADGLSAGAGVQEGDKILAVNRNWVRTADDLTSQLRDAVQEDGRAWLYVERGGERQWVHLDFSGRGQGAWGLVANLRDDQLRVVHVNEGSAAGRAGLRPGDEILSVDGDRVMTGRELDGRLRSAASGNGEAVIRIVRNGQEQDVTARLRGSAQPEQDAGILANARLRRLQRRLDSLIGDENDTSTRRLERVRANAEDLRARMAEAREQRDDGFANRVRDRLAAIRTELRDLADESSGERRFELDEMIDLALDLQTQLEVLFEDESAATTEVAVDQNSGQRARATETIDELETNVQTLQATGDAEQQVARIRDSATDLIAQARALLGDEAAPSMDAVRQLRRQAAGLRRELNALAENSGGEVEGQLEEIRDQLAAVSESFSGMAAPAADTAVSAPADVEAQVRGDAEAIVNRLTEISQNATGDIQEQITQLRDRAAELRDQLAGDVNESADQIRARLNQARDQVAALYREMDELATSETGELQTQLVEARDSLGELRSNLSEYARRTLRQANHQAFDASEEITDRVQRAVTRAEVMADRVRAIGAEQFQDQQEQVDELRESVAQLQEQIGSLEEAAEDVSPQAVATAKESATAIGSMIEQLLANAPAEAKAQLEDLQNIATEIVSELEALER